MSTPKTITFKITGVLPSEIEALHQSLRPIPGITESQSRVSVESHGGWSTRNVSFVKLLSSVYDSENESYTVEILLMAVTKCIKGGSDQRAPENERLLLAPHSTLLQIFQALDVFPDKETLKPT